MEADRPSSDGPTSDGDFEPAGLFQHGKDISASKNVTNGPTTAPESTSSSASDQNLRPKRRKKKVEMACVYCRRSHMICDDSRPCQRCIKRGIGHLCYDEPSNKRQRQKIAQLHHKTDPEPGELYPQSSSNNNPTGYGASETTSKTKLPSVFDNLQHQSVISIAGPQQRPNQPSQPPKPISNSVLSQTLPYNQESFFYSEHAGSEFSSLNDFLSMIDDPELVNNSLNDSTNFQNIGGANTITSQASGATNLELLGLLGPGAPETGSLTAPNTNRSITNLLNFSALAQMYPDVQQEQAQPGYSATQTSDQQHPQLFQDRLDQQQQEDAQRQIMESFLHKLTSKPAIHQPVISDLARDKFFLTAADPTTEISPEERLKQVIKAKLEAGLLQPYNYAKGYARLHRYMDNYMNVSSRQRILKPLSIFRPAFRAIARTLKDVDLVLVEESFERMLLDYDRVFTSMAIPACLWRRTGEIYRGNKEFATLVGVLTDDLKDGKLAIYELMSEESAVNFWEKYGAIAFDKGQKAVLTSCNLRTKDGIKRKSCCFSFTIRRDRYNIPSCIVGNFIPIDPAN